MSETYESSGGDADAESPGAAGAGADTDADAADATATDSTADAPDSGAGVPLRIEDLRKTFGGVVAVDGASFAVEEGSLTGLIGPNGAGKSTTFDCITGFHRPDSGSVYLYGEDVTGRRPERLAVRGLVRTFQIARELGEMTVLENMMLAPKGQRGEGLLRSVLPVLRSRTVLPQERDLAGRAWETLDFFEIDHLADERAGNLSGGQRKLLEMARALMTDPDVVLLDEPLAGVNPTLEEKLLDRIHALREEGRTFLMVEHDTEVIMENCDHVVVMHQGSVLTQGSPAAVREDERVIDAYLGGDGA